jgi:hypothetical protein
LAELWRLQFRLRSSEVDADDQLRRVARLRRGRRDASGAVDHDAEAVHAGVGDAHPHRAAVVLVGAETLPLASAVARAPEVHLRDAPRADSLKVVVEVESQRVHPRRGRRRRRRRC